MAASVAAGLGTRNLMSLATMSSWWLAKLHSSALATPPSPSRVPESSRC